MFFQTIKNGKSGWTRIHSDNACKFLSEDWLAISRVTELNKLSNLNLMNKRSLALTLKAYGFKIFIYNHLQDNNFNG